MRMMMVRRKKRWWCLSPSCWQFPPQILTISPRFRGIMLLCVDFPREGATVCVCVWWSHDHNQAAWVCAHAALTPGRIMMCVSRMTQFQRKFHLQSADCVCVACLSIVVWTNPRQTTTTVKTFYLWSQFSRFTPPPSLHFRLKVLVLLHKRMENKWKSM